MVNLGLKKTHLLTILFTVVLATLCLVGVSTIRGQKKPPKIISKVSDIEVLNVHIQNDGSDELVIVEIHNNSYKPIIALTVESRNDKEASGINLHRFGSGDEPPGVVLQPNESTIVKLPLSYLKPNTHFQVGGVMYADGSEEGDESTLRTMREHKQKYKSEGPIKNRG